MLYREIDYLEMSLFNKSMRELITKRKFNSELSLKLTLYPSIDW